LIPLKYRTLYSVLLAATLIVAVSTSSPVVNASTEEIALDTLHGVNFSVPILSAREFADEADGSNFPEDYVPRSLGMIKDYGFNVIRVPFYWESYEIDREAFLNQLEFVVQQAEANDLYVILDNHQWHTGSYFGGIGFPFIMLSSYQYNENYESDVVPFWDDFWNNKRKIWNKQQHFLKQIINRVDNYENVIGYEILNEPVLTDISHYKKLGKYHSFMVKKLRQVTDKILFFDREIRIDLSLTGDELFELRKKIAPAGVQKMNNIVYAPHVYKVPELNNEPLMMIEQHAELWKVPVFITEFAAKDEEQTQENVEAFVEAFEQYGYGWTAWAWGVKSSQYQLVQMDDYNITPTSYLEYLSPALQ
jgi:hypothetical protein